MDKSATSFHHQRETLEIINATAADWKVCTPHGGLSNNIFSSRLLARIENEQTQLLPHPLPPRPRRSLTGAQT